MTAPQISLGSQNCSPIIPRSKFSQQSSRAAGSLLFGKKNVHLPPFAHFGSSHLGSIPSLKRWKSVPIISLLGTRILLYRHQKSSTVLKVYTLRSVCPQVACFCLLQKEESRWGEELRGNRASSPVRIIKPKSPGVLKWMPFKKIRRSLDGHVGRPFLEKDLRSKVWRSLGSFLSFELLPTIDGLYERTKVPSYESTTYCTFKDRYTCTSGTFVRRYNIIGTKYTYVYTYPYGNTEVH